jgi:HK97 family phage major capsid protein
MADDTEHEGESALQEPEHAAVRAMIAGEQEITKQAQRELVKRNAKMREFGEKFSRWGGRDLASKAELDPTISFDAFREQMLALVQEKMAAIPEFRQAPAGPMPYEQVGSGQTRGAAPWGSAREIVHMANLRAFRGIGKLLHMEDHEAAYRAGMWIKGAIFGDPASLRWCMDAGVHVRQGTPEQLGWHDRSMVEGIFTSGGWLVPVEMEAAVVSNREQYGAARRICNVIPMGTAAMNIPRITGDVSAYFAGEGTAGTESQNTGDQIQITLKDLMAYSRIGKSTATDAVVPLAEMVAREQARAFAVKEDACLIIGDGTSTYGGIYGLIPLLETAAYAGGRYTATANVDTFPEVTAGDLAGVIGKLPVYSRTGARWLSSGVFEANVFGRLKLAAGGNTNMALREGILESDFAGFPVTVAHDMPSSPSADLSSKVMCLLGNFQLGVAFGTGSGMMLTVDPYTQAEYNLIRIITTERIDINCHGVNKSTTIAGPIVCLYGN